MDTIIFIETNKSGSSREVIQAAEKLNFFYCFINKQNKIY